MSNTSSMPDALEMLSSALLLMAIGGSIWMELLSNREVDTHKLKKLVLNLLVESM